MSLFPAIMRICLAFTLCLIAIPENFAVAADSEPAAQPPEKGKFHLYLLVGQSNMAGRGKVSAEDRTPHPRVLVFNRENEWVPAADPLHFDKPTMVGTGLGKTFGMIMAEREPDVTIGLIPCAVGGTSIDAWQPGAFDKVTKTHPWDDCLQRAKLAFESGTLKGILWHQGESDSTDQKVGSYEQKLTDLIARFRSELQAPEIPFIIGQLGQFASKPWTEARKEVDRIMHRVANTVPNVSLASSEGLTDTGDGIHFDAESLREFGKRYADAYLKLTSK